MAVTAEHQLENRQQAKPTHGQPFQDHAIGGSGYGRPPIERSPKITHGHEIHFGSPYGKSESHSPEHRGKGSTHERGAHDHSAEHYKEHSHAAHHHSGTEQPAGRQHGGKADHHSGHHYPLEHQRQEYYKHHDPDFHGNRVLPQSQRDGIASEALKLAGLPVNSQNIQDAKRLVDHESGWDPHNQNNYDINARRGTPSKGLAQTIQPTFNAYHIQGHNDIWNPVDNLAAGLNYMQHRYGQDSLHRIANRHSGY